MCGRFNILADAKLLMTEFEVLRERSRIASLVPHYNVSPSRRNLELADATAKMLTSILIVRAVGGQRELHTAIWPLIPLWSKGFIPKHSTANARCETLDVLTSYRSAWRKKQRCLIPATGFYEWQVLGDSMHKQPWRIYHCDQNLMGFAGIWERYCGRDGSEVLSCSIITTEANALMARIHNTKCRMPVIVDPDNQEQWLNGNDEDARALMATYVDGALEVHQVSKMLNNPLFDAPQCVEPTSAPIRY